MQHDPAALFGSAADPPLCHRLSQIQVPCVYSRIRGLWRLSTYAWHTDCAQVVHHLHVVLLSECVGVFGVPLHLCGGTQCVQVVPGTSLAMRAMFLLLAHDEDTGCQIMKPERLDGRRVALVEPPCVHVLLGCW